MRIYVIFLMIVDDRKVIFMLWLDIKEFFKDAFKYILTAIIVIFIFLYIVCVQQVVGPSMQPTMMNGDVALLSRIHYKFFSIKRNDIVSLDYADTKYLIKRVVGLPGESIAYKNNILYINGVSYKETFLNDDVITNDFSLTELGYSKIPKDMYLVLGDNRSNSMDSREIGLISKKDIKGKVFLRIWPLNKFDFLK